MHSFKDNKGREWKVDYDLPTVLDVQDRIGVNLLTRQGTSETAADFLSFARVLFATVQDQADAQNVDRKEFLRSLEGVQEQAVDAWLKAIADFFRRVGRDGLALLAESAVAIEVNQRQTDAELVTRDVAQRITQRLSEKEKAARRSWIEKTLAETPGSTSPS